MKKLHSNCKHWEKNCKSEPCKSCLRFVLDNSFIIGKNAEKSEWEPREEKEVDETVNFTQKVIDGYVGSIRKIVKQLEWCNYENEAGPLKNNIAFIALKQMAEKEPKQQEEKEVDETVSTWEMIKALMENPKRKAIDQTGQKVSIDEEGCFIDEDGDNACIQTQDKWTIIEPPKQLKKMTLQDMVSLHNTNRDLTWDDFASIETARIFDGDFGNLKIVEIEGFWQCKGVYEDE